MTGTRIEPPIEVRLAAAGLPPLPRTAWLELDLDALTGNLATLRVLADGNEAGAFEHLEVLGDRRLGHRERFA